MLSKCKLCNGELISTKDERGQFCLNCGHIYANSLSTQLLNDFASSFRKDENLDKLRLKAYQVDLESCSNHFENKVNKILDVGCSDGIFTKMIAERYPQKEVVGIDIDKNSIERAIENNEFLNCNFLHETIECIDKHSFDCIVFRGTFQYFQDPRTFLNESVGQLKSKIKIIILSLPNSESLGYELNKEKWRLGDLNEVANVYSLKSVQTLFSEMGFVLDYIELPYRQTPYYCPVRESENDHYTISRSDAFYGNILNMFFVR